MPKVFISYSHDSPEYQKRVLALANRLRRDGIDCMVDQYLVVPHEGWPRWMDLEIRQADFVLLACTETYYRRVMGEEQDGKGLGVSWESYLIWQHIYNARADNTKFIPIFIDTEKPEYIPTILQSTTFYTVHSEIGYEDLYRRLTNQPRTIKPKLGQMPTLPLYEIKSAGISDNLNNLENHTAHFLHCPDEYFDLTNYEIDAQLAVTLTQHANTNTIEKRQAIVDGLIAEVSKRKDPTERYWIYITLGEIGGKVALEALSTGLNDPDEFARKGASDALAICRTRIRCNFSKRKRPWWRFVAMIFSCTTRILNNLHRL